MTPQCKNCGKYTLQFSPFPVKVLKNYIVIVYCILIYFHENISQVCHECTLNSKICHINMPIWQLFEFRVHSHSTVQSGKMRNSVSQKKLRQIRYLVISLVQFLRIKCEREFLQFPVDMQKFSDITVFISKLPCNENWFHGMFFQVIFCLFHNVWILKTLYLKRKWLIIR